MKKFVIKHPWILPLMAVIILGVLAFFSYNYFAGIYNRGSDEFYHYFLFISLPNISLVVAGFFLYITLLYE
jgi:hypothetical protein